MKIIIRKYGYPTEYEFAKLSRREPKYEEFTGEDVSDAWIFGSLMVGNRLVFLAKQKRDCIKIFNVTYNIDDDIQIISGYTDFI